MAQDERIVSQHFTPKKRFGQHFLTDLTVVNHIIQAIQPQPEDNVVEIGPGLGALTTPLLKQLKRLNVVEIDNAIAEIWTKKEMATLFLFHQDALTFDYGALGDALRIVGNLPYNIATPLLIYWLDFLDTIQDIHVMVQKEVASRIAATPHTKAYGRLSVMLQAFCEVTYLFDVAPSAFTPAPKVESAVIRLVPREKAFRDKIDKPRLEALLKKAFAMRRKTLWNNLKGESVLESLSQCGISKDARAEELTVEQYILLGRQDVYKDARKRQEGD